MNEQLLGGVSSMAPYTLPSLSPRSLFTSLKPNPTNAERPKPVLFREGNSREALKPENGGN